MVRSINCVGGNQRKPPVIITTHPKCANLRGLAHITMGAFKELGGFSSMGGITFDGITSGRTDQVITNIPSVLVRELFPDKVKTHRVYISYKLLSALAQHFELEESLINGSFFIKSQGEWSETGKVEIAPSWQELVDPEWKNDFFQWIQNPKKHLLPNPCSFSWGTIDRGFMTMPGMLPAINIGDKTEGTLQLTYVQTTRQCSLHALFSHQGKLFDFRINANNQTVVLVRNNSLL
ncbi:MAG: hypothetical protein ABIH50_00290 [bacterium]